MQRSYNMILYVYTMSEPTTIWDKSLAGEKFGEFGKIRLIAKLFCQMLVLNFKIKDKMQNLEIREYAQQSTDILL